MQHHQRREEEEHLLRHGLHRPQERSTARGIRLIGDGDQRGVIAEHLKTKGLDVTLATPSDNISEWAGKTSERWRVRTHLMKLGVEIVVSHGLDCFDGETAMLNCEYSGQEKPLPVVSVVMVTQRSPDDTLYQELLASVDGQVENLPFSLKRIGDCEAPAIIAAATYAGHKYARELDTTVDADEPLRHDRIDVGETPTSNPASGFP